MLIPVSFNSRPDLVVDSFSTFALSIVYSADNSWNCFPSMHVAMSLLASLTILEVHRIRGIFATLLTVLIAASTVLIKQHYVMDLVAGMVITLAVYFLFIRRRIHDILFTNIQKMEVGLEGWITRKIEQKVDESMGGPLKEQIHKVLRPMVRDVMEEIQAERARSVSSGIPADREPQENEPSS
jgi:hypothetical protein